MTIRDVARIADVSTATVSKIINKKDSNISAETRERVLKIIKEYNYTPYSNIRIPLKGTTLLIGVLVESNQNAAKKISGVLRAIHREGYNALVCPVFSEEEEEKKISFLLSYNVDGIVILHERETELHTSLLQDTPYVVIEENASADSFGIHYDELAEKVTHELITRKHKKIACFVPDNSQNSRDFITGFQNALIKAGISHDNENAFVFDTSEFPVQISHYSSAVCLGKYVAERVKANASNLSILIPSEFSIVCAETSDIDTLDAAHISTLNSQNLEIGDYATTALIRKLENAVDSMPTLSFISSLNHTETIDEAREAKEKKIISVGTINMDIYYSLQEFVHPGEQVTVSNSVRMPGGKGLNQAVGVAKLGVQTHLISCLGKDYEGGIIYDYLKANRIGIEGIPLLPGEKTGYCTILGTSEGETMIYGFDGASKCLSSCHILQNDELFNNASYCIFQDSVKEDLLKQVLRTAHMHGCRVLMRPASSDWHIERLKNLGGEKVDIFQVNKRTLADILPGNLSYEEKAARIRAYGVDCVIITLGHRGYYILNDQYSLYFPAIKIEPLDTTGAADEFAATLCVYLSEGKDILTAANFANIAAGLSTTRHGAATAMVDRKTLELYISKLETQK